MIRTALTSRMGRRVCIALSVCAVLPALVVILAVARHLIVSGGEMAAQRLRSTSEAQARELAARLEAAETILQTYALRDAGDGSALRQQLIGSPVFESVVIVERHRPLADDRSAFRPSLAQLKALDAGRTVLAPVAVRGRLPAVFLARAVSAAGASRLAYFELSPQWLWRDLPSSQADIQVGIVDAEARVLRIRAPIAPEVSGMFARHIDALDGQEGVRRTLSWQEAQEEWRGALAHVPLASERITAAPWAVIAFMREPTTWSLAGGVWQSLPFVTLAALLVVGMAALYLAHCYLPPLLDLRLGFAALQAQRFEGVRASGVDEPRELIDELNRCARGIQEQFRARETLGEIDQLLLGSADLEQVLDAILSRVQAVTRCDSVGIVLRDADAPGRGRMYLAASGIAELPVSRVELDDYMLATLAAETRGLTIVRCEDGRHSFLKPLNDMGAEIFWVWPVIVSDRVEAILAVGYREAPVTDPRIARCGGEFAERLAVALSKSARDEQLYRQAHYDPLTALPNRLLFRDCLARELSNAAAGLARGALLYIDLDHFKKVNDTVGHGAGDQLLTIIAQRLRACIKDGDTVARLGGDEFTVILRNVAGADAARCVSQRIVESLQHPVNIGGRDHFVSASIGITLFPDDSVVIDDLVRNADTAMYRAKELGRGRMMFFERDMAVKLPPLGESGLQHALRRREFSLYYQPQFAVADGSLAGIEALLRWQTPRDGMRQPDDFVPAAEESGLIVDIGGWVLDAACAQLAAWRDKGISPPRLAINVSAQQVRHAEFAKTVRRTLERYELPAQVLELELTESVFADQAAGAVLARLAQMGVRLALDDFGTGYSSLGYLRQCPISTVKIDRSFLEEVPHNAASSTLVETIIIMAHALGKRVVAKGVETIEQLDFLRERRCDLVQGFYLARPVTAQAVTELLRARSPLSLELPDVRATG